MILPEAVMRHLGSEYSAAPKPDHPFFANQQRHIIASAAVSLEAAAAKARALGIEAVILSDAIEGEARDIGRMHAAIARETALRNRPFSKPVVLPLGW
jgi:glycerate 2-kinase